MNAAQIAAKLGSARREGHDVPAPTRHRAGEQAGELQFGAASIELDRNGRRYQPVEMSGTIVLSVTLMMPNLLTFMALLALSTANGSVERTA